VYQTGEKVEGAAHGRGGCNSVKPKTCGQEEKRRKKKKKSVPVVKKRGL